jgi:hypothetical protein
MAETGGWTIQEAVEQFARQGMPVDPEQFRMVVRAFRIQLTGEKRHEPGSQGGRRDRLYEIGQLQRVHSWLMEVRSWDRRGAW